MMPKPAVLLSALVAVMGPLAAVVAPSHGGEIPSQSGVVLFGRREELNPGGTGSTSGPSTKLVCSQVPWVANGGIKWSFS